MAWKLRDGPAELLALGHVAHGLREQGLERARHLRRAHEGAVQPDGAGGHGGRAGAAAMTGAPLHVSVSRGSSARLRSAVTLAPPARRRARPSSAVGLATTTTCSARAAPRHARRRAAEPPARAGARERSARSPRARAPRVSGPSGTSRPALGEEPAADDRLGERHRRARSGRPRARRRARPARCRRRRRRASGTSGSVRPPSSSALPELRRATAPFSADSIELGGDEIGEEPRDGVGEERLHLVHGPLTAARGRAR